MRLRVEYYNVLMHSLSTKFKQNFELIYRVNCVREGVWIFRWRCKISQGRKILAFPFKIWVRWKMLEVRKFSPKFISRRLCQPRLLQVFRQCLHQTNSCFVFHFCCKWLEQSMMLVSEKYPENLTNYSTVFTFRKQVTKGGCTKAARCTALSNRNRDIPAVV